MLALGQQSKSLIAEGEMEKILLETDRLRLRRWKDSDVEPFAAICGDPEVMKYIGDGSTRTLEETARSIEQFEIAWEERGFGLFAVELRATGELLGFTGFAHPDFLPELLPSVEIGWRFGKQYWGRGYATEAAIGAMEFASNVLADQQIVSICQVGNTASTRIMAKIGLEYDRRMIDRTCNREVEVYRLPAD